MEIPSTCSTEKTPRQSSFRFQVLQSHGANYGPCLRYPIYYNTTVPEGSPVATWQRVPDRCKGYLDLTDWAVPARSRYLPLLIYLSRLPLSPMANPVAPPLHIAHALAAAQISPRYRASPLNIANADSPMPAHLGLSADQNPQFDVIKLLTCGVDQVRLGLVRVYPYASWRPVQEPPQAHEPPNAPSEIRLGIRTGSLKCSVPLRVTC
jgi:hypothetical protein